MFNKITSSLFNSPIFAGIGLACLGVYNLSQGDYSTALNSFLAAAAAFGITKQVNTSHKMLMANQKMMFSAMKLSAPCDEDKKCCKQ